MVMLLYQIHHNRRIQAAQLLAHSRQSHEQCSDAAAHPANAAEPAAQSGAPQTGELFFSALIQRLLNLI